MKKCLQYPYAQNRGVTKILLTMRIALLLIGFGLLNVNANVYSQLNKFSLNANGLQIKEVLKEMELNSSYKFFYTDNLAYLNNKINLVSSNASVEQVLDEILEDSPLTYKVFENNLVVILPDNAGNQQIVIKGRVTDSNGESLPGVNILEKGTSNGGITDLDGNYAINLSSSNAVLTFSFVGFLTEEVEVAGQTTIDIIMVEDIMALDEVVVTALGIKREAKQLGYAMTEVTGEEVAKLNTVSPVLALQGQSAGLSIGGSDGGLFGNNKIQIRGVSVLNSENNQPIFVVDGVILENSVSNASADWSSSPDDFGNILKNLNPADYESVSVLKGAAATALYGSRGINGAIVIKTKDGKSQKGLGVSVSQSFGIDYVYAQPDIQYEYGVGDTPGFISYGDTTATGSYYRFDHNQFNYNANGIPTNINHPAGYFYYGPKYDGRTFEDYDGTMTTYTPFEDHMLDIYDTGINTNTSLVLKGGNDRGSFYASYSYNHRTGNLPKDEFTRNAFLLNSSYKLNNWLTAETSVSYTLSNPKNPKNNLGDEFLYGTFGPMYNADKYMKREVWQAPHGGVPSSDYGDEYANVPSNSVWFEYNLNESSRQENVIRPIARLTAEIADWFSLTAEANMNYYTTFYEQKDLGTGYANEGGYYEQKHSRDVSKTGKLTANIYRDLTPDLSANLILGGELWSQEKSYTRVYTNGGLIVPGRFFIENSKETKGAEGKIEGTKQINSLYYLLNLAWKDQLFLDVTGRNDWASSLVYSNGSGNYSYFYPSVSTSWVFNETFQLPSWFTFGKLRLSWAQVGNDTDAYSINKGYESTTVEQSNGDYVYLNTKSTTLVDSDIKPEKKNSYEAGFDVRFINNRIGVDFAYFNETINNQIGEIPTPETSGYEAMFTNIGTMTNKGVELSLKLVPVRTSTFEWSSTFNYWNSTTMISDLREEVGAYKSLAGYVDYGNYRVGSVAFEDGEYGVLMSDTKPRVWEGEAGDARNGMKVLTWYDSYRAANYTRSGEVEEVGKIQPDFEGSWNNSFRYKNLTLSFLLDARFGGHMASFSSKYGTAWGLLEESLYARDEDHGGVAWTSQYSDDEGKRYTDGVIPDGVFAEGQEVTAPNGDVVNVGGMTFQEAYDAGYVEPTHAGWWNWRNSSWGGGVINDSWFSEVKFVALRNVSIGYNLPQSLANKIKAQNVYVSLNGRNLAYLYNSLPNNINPESFRGTTSSASYYERGFRPYVASYTLTVNIDF